jgi:hypothetical protein
MWSIDGAAQLAETYLAGMGPRWAHVQSVGRLAATLTASGHVSEVVSAAAWLHDLGYAPSLVRTGFHPVDGALFLQESGAPVELVGLVAHHTAARFEAEERSLSDALAALPMPGSEDLDALTLVDLVVDPSGAHTSPCRRLDEVLTRYGPDDPVHRAISRSRPYLLESAARARRRLGLPDEWPLVSAESMPKA